jgi:hypothetical protein
MAKSGWNIGREMSKNYEWFDWMIGAMASWKTEKELVRYLKQDINLGNLIEGPLGSHFLKHVAQERDVLNLTLKAHLYIENFLEEILKRKFMHGAILLNNRDVTFSLKLDILRAKNYLDEKLYHDIRLINRLRNKFAHELTFDIGSFDMSQFSYCEGLYQDVRTKKAETRRLVNIHIFKHVLLYLLLRLTEEHEFIAEIKKP